MEDFVINYNLSNIRDIFSIPFITKNNNWKRYPLKREMDDIINSNISPLLSKYSFIEKKLKNPKYIMTHLKYLNYTLNISYIY
jgi:hypothetical protein